MNIIYKAVVTLLVMTSILPVIGIGSSPIGKNTTMSQDMISAQKLGILLGDDNGISSDYLNEQPTRSQVALITLRLRGLAQEALSYKGSENFADASVAEEYWQPMLSYLYDNKQLGWNGIDEWNNFNPNGLITGRQYLKVLLETLGYTYGKDFTWDDVYKFATCVGIDKPSEDLRLSELASVTLDALTAYTSEGELFIETLIDKGIVNRNTVEEINLLKDFVNVRDYGAKGDGITDDTNAIRKAIYEASAANKKVLIPESEDYYLVSDSLYLYNNTHIVGYDATVFMNSNEKEIKSIFFSNDYIKDVTIEGISLKSINDRSGDEYYKNSLISNVQGIHISGVENLVLKNIFIENMNVGLKLSDSTSKKRNENIYINNVNIYNARTPIYISSTNDVIMRNSILDATGGADPHLHAIYINGDTSNMIFENVSFMNSPGGGIHIFNSYRSLNASNNITFDRCTIENAEVGIYIFSGAKNITVKNSSIKNCTLGFKITDATGVDIISTKVTDTKVSNARIEDYPSAFYIKNLKDSTISHISIDASKMEVSLFTLEDNVKNVEIRNANAFNMGDIRIFSTASEGINNLVVENSKFEWTNISTQRISFRGEGAQALFKGNMFINHGSKYDYVCYNYPYTNIILKDNKYKGFREFCYANDYSKAYHNYNLDSKSYDNNKY